MIFVYKKWKEFCGILATKHIVSIPSCEISKKQSSFLVLKHDVETNVKKAFKLAKIETRYGHRGSYYVQAYLLKNPKNIEILHKMQRMGHEISYHYDVLDFAHGNIELAKQEFAKNKSLFEDNGFQLITVCQHGNPLIERKGYTSNRDFFRNVEVQQKYKNISDIMVNFKSDREVDYLYFSDAGRKFKFIFDPINNDVINSDSKNIPIANLIELGRMIESTNRFIVSTHPHRWCSSSFVYCIKALTFKIIRFTAKLFYKIPFMKKFISKHYSLAKKI